ncbi:hypothetical protein DQ04_07011020 [Trypanosoma grayi]|uniref:hypothetical protein n=1 Tax=Trypanosoma grayi TaxID=71804 RepID=UPI0004F48E24|nr:hypothetical protein DQ04_07011020 [Trypanosoma grayi]KEG08511.1 hypothetical protein DQ04_07011020 [Trypanosoma grayi]
MKQSHLCRRLLCVFLLFVGLVLHGVEARASAESELVCSPVLVEPSQWSYCTINVRDSQQEPTMAFEVGEFSVAAYSSVSNVTVNVTSLRRGDDVTTVTFAVSASEGTNIIVNAVYVWGSQSAPIRNSGLVVSVMSWPAVRMGPIVCDVPAAGLVLRSTTTCSARLYHASNREAVVHESEIAFLEEKNLGTFLFISGMRSLVFNFTAASSPTITGASFALHVTLNGGSSTYSVKFPLLCPELYPVASSSLLVCSNETLPIACTLRAADTVGPVRLNLDHFRLVIDMLDEESSSSSKWVDKTNAFDISFHPLKQAETAVLSWKLKVNNMINSGRLHVYVMPLSGGGGGGQTGGGGNTNNSKFLEVRGSPFTFLSGVVPNAAYVSLRGCRVAMISSGNRTQCFIDLQNGVTGDVRYFHLASTIEASIDNMQYLPEDPVFHTPVVSFAYTAPVVERRTEDFITLLVGGQSAIRSPFRMNVFPLRTDTGGDAAETLGAHNAVIIAVGLAFFGVIIGGGSFIALQRSIRINRIRSERALQKAKMQEEMEGRTAGGQISIDAVPQAQRHHESESD